MRPFSFRHKILLLAIALVAGIQLVTLFPVLNLLKQDAERQAERSRNLAGVVFDEFMQNRTTQLLTTVDVLVSDYAFRDTVANGDRATIESALINHSARAGAEIAVVFDPDGQVLAAAGTPTRVRLAGATPFLSFDPEADPVSHGVTYIGDSAYQTVTVPLRAPVTIAWVMLGFSVDAKLAHDIEGLTGMHTTFLRLDPDGVELFASTLPSEHRAAALSEVRLGSMGTANTMLATDKYLTSMQPFMPDQSDLYVAMQLPLSEVTASYLSIRNLLILISSVSLVLAVGGAIWVAGMVTRPVQVLAAAVRRMREGVYTEPINTSSTDELGELAAGFNSMQEAIADRERHIFHIAHHDSLSGLPTRDIIVSRLRDKITDGKQLAVVNLALNRFDGIASSLGYRTADEVIKLVAGVLRNIMTGDELLGHLKHQEFVLILPGLSADQACDYVHRLRDALRAGVTVRGANISLQATAGVACYPEHSHDAAELLRYSSIARNDAEQRAEPVVTYRAGQEDRAVQLVRIVGDFPKALQNNDLELHFQPKIDCNTGTLVGAEALVRWQHPELGALQPDVFVDAIEQAGGVAHLTRWVLREAMRCCANWRSHGVDIAIAVNISADDLVDEFLPYYLLELTGKHGLKPTAVTLEITESAIMRNVQMSLAVISCMRELGFRVAIDDFGTGQSALAQLKRLPVDELKIDKSFVVNLDNARDEAIVRASIELGHQFSLCVVAEGVEDEATLERLRAMGCEFAQGFHISRPVGTTEFLRWAKRWTASTDIVALVAEGTGSFQFSA
jgi:diguanylate cyclase (GGDEF)-like protein